MLGALGILCVLPPSLAGTTRPWLAVLLRPGLAGGLWGLAGIGALAGAVFGLAGAPDWFPVFGLDGPALPMLVLLAFIGICAGGLQGGMRPRQHGIIQPAGQFSGQSLAQPLEQATHHAPGDGPVQQGDQPWSDSVAQARPMVQPYGQPQEGVPSTGPGQGGAHGLACVLAGFAFLALSPLVFGLFAAMALALLDGRGRRALWLPFAVLPVCISADNILSVPLLCLSLVQTGWAVSVQKGPVALLPACIGLFLLGRILAEMGMLPVGETAVLLACGAWVALRGCLRALGERSVQAMLGGFAAAWYGGLVIDLVLALTSALDGADAFRMAVELGMGAPLLALLAVQFLAARLAGGSFAAGGAGAVGMAGRGGRVLAGLCLCQLSAAPPFGIFAVLWSLLLAGDYSVQGARPVVAVGVVVLLAFQAGVIVLASLGLLRAGLQLVLPPADTSAARETLSFTPVRAGPAGAFAWPGWICAGAAGLVSAFPGVWLFVAGPMVAPTAMGDEPLPLTVGSSFVVRLAQGESQLTPLLVLAAMLGAVAVAAVLVRALGFVPFGQGVVRVPFWRQGAPLSSDGPGEGQGASVMPLWPAVMGLSGMDTGRGTIAVTMPGMIAGTVSGRGGRHARRAPARDVARRGRVMARSLRRLVFRYTQWCESQGMVLVVLLLGLGLLVGLFVGT
ncbi:hypothetical protein K2X14_01280 [Acetobacter sp. TBRC 12305]|uniref:Uncharacterized protein n=1 Tax=Acetobacter garciniae TaxID=2817435 RepID=A0A939KLT2_9PROT|nr:hypothetical protein [Acetobacter garciniae]MBO1323785.1 hypothetical protein [Acetobacter garciniae]MBX0343474.1 hypothetical protein [Acetobacter garciniae]